MTRKQRSGIWKIYSEDEACKLIEGWYKLQQNTLLIKHSSWWSIDTRDRGNRIDFHVKTKVKEQMRFYITWFEPSEWLSAMFVYCARIGLWVVWKIRKPDYFCKHNFPNMITLPSDLILSHRIFPNFYEKSKGEGLSESYGYGTFVSCHNQQAQVEMVA